MYQHSYYVTPLMDLVNSEQREKSKEEHYTIFKQQNLEEVDSAEGGET